MGLRRSDAVGFGLYRKASDGTGQEEQIASFAGDQSPYSVSPDGKTLIFARADPKTGRDLWTLPLNGDRTARPLLVRPGNQENLALSPDGRWIAYQSDVPVD